MLKTGLIGREQTIVSLSKSAKEMGSGLFQHTVAAYDYALMLGRADNTGLIVGRDLKHKPSAVDLDKLAFRADRHAECRGCGML